MNEDCNSATQITLNLDDAVTFQVPITPATGNEIDSYCVDFDEDVPDTLGDLVYELTVVEACTLNIQTTGMGNTEFSLRTVCEEDEFFCLNVNPTAGERYLGHQVPGTWSLVVQGDPGDYTLDISCTTPICGDFVQNPGEECDFGDTANGDGCDQNCNIEDPDPAVEDCNAATAGAAILVGMGVTFIPNMANGFATTLGALENEHGSCNFDPTIFGVEYTYAPDHVYRIRPTVSGTFTATVGLGFDGVPLCGADVMLEPALPYPAGCWDRSIYARQSNCTSGMELDCSESNEYWVPETISFPVTANTDYFVFVDGWLAGGPVGEELGFNAGPYTIRVEITP